MNKKEILDAFKMQLQEEELRYKALSEKARESAIDKEILQEAKYDTRAIEAGYLAGSLARRYEEIILTKQDLEAFTPKDFKNDDPIAVGALVSILEEGKKLNYFITPKIGGLSALVEAEEVQALSATSRLGQFIIGAHVGECLEFSSPRGIKEIKILSIL